MKASVIAVALVMIASPALADAAPTGTPSNATDARKSPPPPAFRALGQMVEECQQREAQSLAASYAELDQVTSLQKQLADLEAAQRDATTKK